MDVDYTVIFANYVVLNAENERDLQKIAEEFNVICKKRRLKVT